MVEEDFSRRKRSSGVLDAIFEAVEEKPESAERASSPFRAAALARLDMPQQIDNLLPLASRRTWIAVVGVILAIVAFVGYAAVTTTVTQFMSTGRVVSSAGITSAVSPDAGVLASVVVAEGDIVRAGQVLASGVDREGDAFEVTASVSGTVWQLLGLSGGVVAPGSAVATVLPEGSESSVLVALTEGEASAAASAIRVDISPSMGATVTGVVTAIANAPVPVEIAAARTALPQMSGAQATMVVVTPQQPLTAGSEVSVAFVQSESTLLQRILGMG